MTLVIMAAGMGSRFGGLKQIEPIDEYGNFILDYSVYDAIQAGFTKVVFVIKKENYDIFRETVGKRVEKYIEVDYIFQEVDKLPGGIKAPETRVKPWGTGHAVLCCKDVVKENFAVINADDFYGRDGIMKVAEFLRNTKDDEIARYGMVAYELGNTITENGSVKRGVCKVQDGYLSELDECKIEENGEELKATSLIDGSEYDIPRDAPVSINLFGFTPSVFKCLEDAFVRELEVSDLDTYELFLPSTVFGEVRKGVATIKVITTDAVWLGVTYREDKERVVKGIKALVDKGVYPEGLWK